MCVCVLGLGRVLLLGGDVEGLHSLVVVFSETVFIVMVPVMPRSSQVQDLVSHSSYTSH